MSINKIHKGEAETAPSHSSVVDQSHFQLDAGVSLTIATCDECPFVYHSGAFTPGGAKPICSHRNAVETFGEGITDVVDGFEDRYHWRHRIVDRNAPPPPQCPIRHGQDTKSSEASHNNNVAVEGSVQHETESVPVVEQIIDVSHLAAHPDIPIGQADCCRNESESSVSSTRADAVRVIHLVEDTIERGQIFETDVREELITTIASALTNAASNMKTAIVNRVREKAELEFSPLGVTHKTLLQLAMELESVELEGDQP